MRKLQLKLEELQIESFTTDAVSLQRGTVRGRSSLLTTLTEDATYRIAGCPEGTGATCGVSCGYGDCPQTPNTACEM